MKKVFLLVVVVAVVAWVALALAMGAASPDQGDSCPTEQWKSCTNGGGFVDIKPEREHPALNAHPIR